MQNAPTALLREVLLFPRTVSHVFMEDATPQTVTVPTGAVHVKVSVTGLCYMKAGGASATPVATVQDGSGVVMLTPGDVPPLNVKGLSEFSINADAFAVGAAASAFIAASFCWYGDHSG